MDSTHQIETQLAAVVAYLRAELGYDADAPGNLRREVEENSQMIRSFDDALRGRGDELGLVGWLMVIRRTWITLVALLSAAFGYFLKDVVDTMGVDQASPRSAAMARQE